MSAGVEAREAAAPSRPGFWRAAGLIAAKDLRIEWRTLDTLSSMLLFSLIVLVVFSFAFGLATIKQLGAERLVPGVLWTVLAFSAIVAFSRSFQSERQNDTLAAIQLAPLDAGSVFVGKAVANLVKVLLLEIVILPLSVVFFDYDLPSPGVLSGVVLLHTLGLVELGTLVAAIAARLGRGEALVATLLFPFCVPLFISAVKCTAAAIEGKGFGDMTLWISLTAGFNVLFFLLALMTFEFVLEE